MKFIVQKQTGARRWNAIGGADTLSEACSIVWARLRSSPKNERVAYRVRDGRKTVASMAWTVTEIHAP
jgi:hypothetical protein